MSEHRIEIQAALQRFKPPALTLIGINSQHYLLQLLSLLLAVAALYFHFQLLTNLVEALGRAGETWRKELLNLRTVRTVLAAVMALPVLSVMGVQPVALPTVVLSTHTGGLGTPARLDGSAYGQQALEHYHALGVEFDCIYTGYLGGEAQVALAEKAFALWPAAYKVVDPVMGDNGKAYSTVTPALIERIRNLCRAADLILPNYTESRRA